MYYITKRNSETGKKFQLISDRMTSIFEQQKQLSYELGFDEWRQGNWVFYGGYSSLIFPSEPDKKVYKETIYENEWMPRLNTKLGKGIQAKLDSIPTISIDEANQCIGFNGAPFKMIGFSRGNEEYFGFSIREEWKIKVPLDCQEVTTTMYNSLFKNA